MTAFWILFWLSFIGFPLLVWLANQMRSGGFSIDRSHIWVRKGSDRKVNDATIRDVWKHNNPGKKWETYQDGVVKGLSIFFGMLFLGFLFWFSGSFLTLPEDSTARRLFWQVGGPLLGGISAAAFLVLQSLIFDLKSNFFKLLNVLALVLMGVGVIGGLVLTFLKRPLPISPHWVWAPAAATCLFLVLGSQLGERNRKRSLKGGSNLEEWVYTVRKYGSGTFVRRELSKISEQKKSDYEKKFGIMFPAVWELKLGELDFLMRDENFFKQTESIMLDLVSGHPMTLADNELYKNQKGIIRALQEFYFTAVNKYGHHMHPRIKAKLKK